MQKRGANAGLSWMRVTILCCLIFVFTAVVAFNIVTLKSIFSRPRVYVELQRLPADIGFHGHLPHPFGAIKSTLQNSKHIVLIISSCETSLETELNYLSFTLAEGASVTIKHNCKKLSLPKSNINPSVSSFAEDVPSDFTFIKLEQMVGFCNNTISGQLEDHRKNLDKVLNQLESAHGMAALYRDSWSIQTTVDNQFECAEELRWYGEAVDYFLQSHLEWVLEFEPFFDVETQPEPSIFVLRRRVNPMWERLQLLQFPADCRDRASRGSLPSFLMQIFWNAGFGSYLNQVAVGLTAGHVYDRTIVFDGDWRKYGHRGPECLGADLSPYCYFMNYTNCTGWDALSVYREKAGNQNTTFWRRLVWQQKIEDPEDVAMYVPDDIMLFFQILPTQLKKQIMQWGVPTLKDFRLYTNEETRPLLELGMRPRRWMREELHKKRKDNQAILEKLVPNQYVAMHVRHGDKWKENPLPDFQKFMNHLQKWSNPHKTVYLATDDLLVIEATSNYTDYEWVFLSMPREAGKSISMLNDEQLKNRKETMVTLLLELEVLSEAAFLMGSENSNFSYLALRLFYYKQRLREGKLQDKEYEFHKHWLIM